MSLLIDVFGHEYGYTPGQVVDLPFIGALILVNRINDRYKALSGKKKGEMSIDQLRDVMRLG